MPVVYLDLALAAWLLVSVFALGHTPASATINVLGALAVGAVAWLSVKKPTLRFVNTAVTLFLAALAVLLPSLSVAARVNTLVVALVLLALSAFVPGHLHGRVHPAVPAGRPPGED